MMLHGSAGSPFVRKCRIVALEQGIDLPMEVRTVLNPETPPPSPLRRIPSLQLDDGMLLVDSRVICDYLLGMQARSLQDRNLEAICDGIMNRAVSRFLMLREPEQFHHKDQLDRWESAILDTVGSMEAPIDAFGVGEISLVCALGYLDFRHADLDWRRTNEALSRWFKEISSRPSVQQTEPPA